VDIEIPVDKHVSMSVTVSFHIKIIIINEAVKKEYK